MANGNNGNNDKGNADKLWTAVVNAGAGVVVVLVALIVLAIMTSYLVSAVKSDDAKLAIATTALGVISAVIAAFFGVKSATAASRAAWTRSRVRTMRSPRAPSMIERSSPAMTPATCSATATKASFFGSRGEKMSPIR